MSSPQVPVKNESDADQDDFLMSYLNADCLATDWPALKVDPPSPPYSTSSTDDMKPQPLIDDSASNHWFAAHNEAAAAAAMALPPELFFQPFIPPTAYVPQALSSPDRSGSSSSSDSEQQPRKKRGRKKRDSNVSIAPAPLKPIAPAAINAPFPPVSVAPAADTNTTASDTSSPPPPPSIPSQPSAQKQQQQQPQQQRQNSSIDSEEAQKAAAIAKRQERLIKNRAAALLSRKRKREHLNQLEQERQNLSVENEQLKQRVAMLEAQVDSLQRENQELRTRLNEPVAPGAATKHTNNSRTTGVVFMILLFSFALFSLPARTVDRLTVGGGTAPPLSLAGSSSVDVSFYRARATLDSAPVRPSTTTTKDLALIDPVQPHALQNWLEGKLTKQQEQQQRQQRGSSQELMKWPPQQLAATEAAASPAQIYLYSPEFSQVAPVNDSSHSEDVADNILNNSGNPILSLISPFEANSTFLQIDVQVLGSRIIDSNLFQCPHATSLVPDDDLLCRPNTQMITNETVNADRKPIERSDKRLKKDIRRKLAGQERARKLARVVSP